MEEDDAVSSLKQNEVKEEDEISTKPLEIASSDFPHATDDRDDADETAIYRDDDPSKLLSPENPPVMIHNNNNGNNSGSTRSTQHGWLRSSVGEATTTAMDWANENKIAVRYGVVASITLLTAYGMAHSPLLFRYHSVSELSAQQFRKQSTLHARVVRVVPPSNSAPASSNQQPIRLQVRHLAPLERMLSESAYDTVRKYHPRNNLGNSSGSRGHNSRKSSFDHEQDKLLTVELMGVTHPPEYFTPSGEMRGDWLKNLLAETQAKVRLKLVARRTFPNSQPQSSPTVQYAVRQRARDKKREIPNFTPRRREESSDDDNTIASSTLPRSSSSSSKNTKNQVAIAHVSFWPRHPQLSSSSSSSWWPSNNNWLKLFGGATNLSYDLVRHGRALASDDLWFRSDSRSDDDLVTDVAAGETPDASIRFLESLQQAQLDAACERRGMWADAHVQKMYPETIQEADFQVEAPWYQKLWRRFRDRV